MLTLARLLHLASPVLPVGAFSYSQGLEWAVEQGVVKNEQAAGEWIADMLRFALTRCEARALLAMMDAWRRHDSEAVSALNQRFLAMRETSELRAETLQMGYSLARLLRDLPEFVDTQRAQLARIDEITFPCAWAFAAAHWQLPERDSLTAYLWAWLENQVMGAVKLIPLGQTAGQRLLTELAAALPAMVEDVMQNRDAPWQNFTPAATLASAQHETQYTRLFRS